MNTRIADIDSQVFLDVFCRSCIYWEEPGAFRTASAPDPDRPAHPCAGRSHTVSPTEAEKIKSAWFDAKSAILGPCGKLLYADGVPAAYCQYAPPAHLPRIGEYQGLAAKVDPEAVFISCLYVREGYVGKGLGSRLLREVIEECRELGRPAVETFARDDSDNNCSGPTAFYVRHGFRLVATETMPGGTFSLVRLQLHE